MNQCMGSDGMGYPVGSTRPEDCNTCTCQGDGSWVCTNVDCNQRCDYGGQSYEVGDSFPAGDGCNQCTCGGEGRVGCTLVDCSLCSQPFDPGECEAALPVYWFNSATGACEPQTYGGCGGNENRFETLEACQATCP
jgi:hypothetical protein